MKKPFDEDLTEAFWEASKFLAKNVAGAQLVYHQSDEISLLITNYEKHTTQSWFGNVQSKIESVCASLVTAKFNEVMRAKYPEKELALFDARARIYPPHEVVNYFIWRQQDATKNSVSMVAQANFSHGSLQKLNGSEMQEKLFQEKGINWNDLPVWQKRGVCIKRMEFQRNGATRYKWEVDHETPIISKQKSYVQEKVYTGILAREVEMIKEILK
jgi:tRNA(His) 5'-end guanylyltransferase